MARNKLWLIDENRDQMETYVNVLSRLFPELQVLPMEPKERMQGYVQSVLTDPETACIIIDQKLKDTGVARYFGIELASYLRAIDTKLPIYILTNYPDEKEQFEEGAWSVEDIIDKRELSDLDSNYTRNLKARLLRRINTYNDLLADRERQFQGLLRRSLSEELSPDEMRELEELQSVRGAPIAAIEVELLARVETTLREYEKKMAQYETKDLETRPNDDQ
jgi:hypothetical protein